MMLTVSFQNFDEVRRLYDPKVIQRALNTTISRTAQQARTEVSKAIREVYNIKARDIGQVVALRTRRQNDTTFKILEYRGSALPLDRFGTRSRKVSSAAGRRIGVTAQVRKDRPRRVVRGAFPLRGRDGPTMQRTGEPRSEPRYAGDEAIERVFRLSVPQMINEQAGIVPRVQDFIERAANIELNRNLRFFESRL